MYGPGMDSTHSEPAAEPAPEAQRRIAETVRVRAAGKRLRQTEIQAALGLSETTVIRRMSGDTAWKAHELAALAALLDCPISDLYA